MSFIDLIDKFFSMLTAIAFVFYKYTFRKIGN